MESHGSKLLLPDDLDLNVLPWALLPTKARLLLFKRRVLVGCGKDAGCLE